MSNLNSVSAAKIGVEPVYVRGYEQHGLTYLTWQDSPVVGAQCEFCHSVLWVDQRRNSILTEDKPSDVKESGIDYRKYYDEKIHRFLKALPACPSCGSQKFDRFINNVNYPRFADGIEFPQNVSSSDLIKHDPQTVVTMLSEG